MPGPSSGYSNCSIRLVIAFRGLKSQLSRADPSVRFLIRWAAHSAFNSEHGMPQTFSVYDLKNVRNRRRPNRLVTHCSNVSTCRYGKIRQRK